MADVRAARTGEKVGHSARDDTLTTNPARQATTLVPVPSSCRRLPQRICPVCHPERSSPIFSSGPQLGASGCVARDRGRISARPRISVRATTPQGKRWRACSSRVHRRIQSCKGRRVSRIVSLSWAKCIHQVTKCKVTEGCMPCELVWKTFRMVGVGARIGVARDGEERG